jgi:hypothetical protein
MIKHVSFKFALVAAALLFAASAQAAESYYAFTDGNPDITSDRGELRAVTAMQPSVGADFDRYQGIADGNRDLFGVDLGMSAGGERPDIYGQFGGSRDLAY